MRERSISAIGVVLAVLIPAVFGGPVWAVAITLFCAIGMREFYAIGTGLGIRAPGVAYVAVPIAAGLATSDVSPNLVLLPFAVVMVLSLIFSLARKNAPGSISGWAFDCAAALYLGVPAFAAVAIRQIDGTVGRTWPADLLDWIPTDWNGHARGLAWLAFVISATWLSDTGAYLVGRQFGKTPLFPEISPKKTREGLAGGFAAAIVIGIVVNELCGLGLPALVAGLAAALIATVGVLGDLAESLMKRQAGVKDSGTLIPGHGGMLDRIDALLFTWSLGLFLAMSCDRYWA